MTHLSLARAQSLLRRVFRLFPALAKHPSLLLQLPKAVHPEHYVRLDVNWLRDANIQTVIDIGANSGQFSGAARAVFPRATIYAFEPLPQCFDDLTSRFSADKGFVAFPFALGEREGEVDFNQNAYTQSSSVLELEDLHRTSRSWAARTESIRVEMKRLDDLASQLQLTGNILVKIDVQGYEYEVIEGGNSVISTADIVIVETAFKPLYKGEASFDRIYQSLSRLGLQYSGCLNQATERRTGRPIFADAIFTSKRISRSWQVAHAFTGRLR